MRRAEIQVEIDELALHGVSPQDRDEVATAFRAELARCFCEQGIPASLGSMGARERLDVSEVRSMTGAGNDLGSRAAQAVYGGFSQAEQPKRGAR